MCVSFNLRALSYQLILSTLSELKTLADTITTGVWTYQQYVQFLSIVVNTYTYLLYIEVNLITYSLNLIEFISILHSNDNGDDDEMLLLSISIRFE